MQIQTEPTKPEAMCPRTWDSLLCWPPTAAGTMAQLPCFSELNGIKYDTTSKCHVVLLCNNFRYHETALFDFT